MHCIFSKSLWIRVCFGLFLTIAFALCVRAEEIDSYEMEKVNICAEDELVGISVGGEIAAKTEYYDCQGKYAGFVNTNLGNYDIEKVKKNSLLVTEEENLYVIYELSMPLRKIAEYPRKNRQIWTGKDGYVLGNRKEQKIRVYTKDGTCIYEKKAFLDKNEYNAMSEVSLESFSDGCYLSYIEPMEDGDLYASYHVIKIPFDGSAPEIIVSGEAIKDWDVWSLPEIHAFGDYLICENRVSDSDGQIVLEDVRCVYEPNEIYVSNVDISGVIKKDMTEDGREICTFYDSDLQVIQQCDMTADLYWRMEESQSATWMKCLQGDELALTGAISENLGYEICSGFIAYCGPSYSPVYTMTANVEDWIPYAKTEGGAFVYLNDQCVFLPMKEEEELRAVNDFLYLTIDQSENWVQQIRRQDTGDILIREEGAWFSLEKSFISGYFGYESMIEENAVEVDPVTYEQSLYKVPGMSMPWSDDCLVVHRSIYKGITDKYGNWILKVIDGGMD